MPGATCPICHSAAHTRRDGVHVLHKFGWDSIDNDCPNFSVPTFDKVECWRRYHGISKS